LLLQQWLSEKPFCLSLGAGYFGFYSHCGFISALESVGLKPYFISGASSGALIGSMWASGLSVGEVQHRILKLSKRDFWDPGLGLGLLKGQLFKQLLQDFFPVSRIEQCPIALSLSVFSPLTWQSKMMHVGELYKAVYASCAVPGLFQPQWISGLPHWDGGFRDREAVTVYTSNNLKVITELHKLELHKTEHPVNQINPKHLRVLHHRIPNRGSSIHSKKAPVTLSYVKTIQLKGIPRSGPDLMDLGEEIIQSSKDQMLSLLNKPV
jgi:predicted acylesterase/phospholipase RssA